MRNAVGIFGLICGAVVVGLVARYGYRTTDVELDAWVVATFFGIIATAGLGGHVVAVRLWRTNRFASIAVGIVSGAALVVNLSNSLGAIAGRQEQATTERVAKNRDIRAAESEIARLTKLRSEMPAFVRTDAEAVAAAKHAADAVTIAKDRECGNGDPKQRGHFCRDKETAEAAAMQVWREASTARAETDRANKLEADAKVQRDELANLGPVVTVDVQGTALAKLFRLPDSEVEFAATAQQFGMAMIVELIIIMALVSWELLGRATSSVAPLPWAFAVEAVVEKLSLPPRPKLVATSAAPPAGSIPEIMATVLEPAAKTDRVELAECYAAYTAQCTTAGRRVVTPEQFVEPLQRVCNSLGIKTRVIGDKVFLVGVRLAAAMGDRGSIA
jgi:hypothetical protein